jgi:hypothetical protein
MNANLYYKLFKLSNGDNIVCTTDNDCANLKNKESIYVCDPMLVNPVRVQMGLKIVETFVMIPWVNFAKENLYEIPANHIILAIDVNDKFKELYTGFVEEKNGFETKGLEIENKEQMIEHVINNLINNQKDTQNETKEDTEKIYVRGNRSIH